jgi:YHS domain-containing protein
MRTLIFIILGYVAYRLLKSWLRSLVPPDDEPEQTGSRETELIQDPECGTYFLRQRGVPARVDGETLYFCSESCRNKYLQRQ